MSQEVKTKLIDHVFIKEESDISSTVTQPSISDNLPSLKIKLETVDHQKQSSYSDLFFEGCAAVKFPLAEESPVDDGGNQEVVDVEMLIKEESPIWKVDGERSSSDELMMQAREKVDMYSSTNITSRSTTLNDGMKFACPICSSKFDCHEDLETHNRSHTGDKLLKCEKCNEKFDENGLKIHLRVQHKDEKSFKCVTCSATFTRADHLEGHTRVHTGERPFACGICNARFSHAHNLKRHRATHTGDKPFECDTCNKKFTALNYLKNHAVIHTGEKPFVCKICNGQFKRFADLKIHAHRHYC